MIPRHAKMRSKACSGQVAPGSDICPVREILTRIGDKWSVLVIALLGDGARRFSELRRSIEGISQRMLTLTLKGLERDGLVTRTAYPTIPPRVEYELTKVGRTLLKAVTPLHLWAEKHRGIIQESRTRYDGKTRSTGKTGAI